MLLRGERADCARSCQAIHADRALREETQRPMARETPVVLKHDPFLNVLREANSSRRSGRSNSHWTAIVNRETRRLLLLRWEGESSAARVAASVTAGRAMLQANCRTPVGTRRARSRTPRFPYRRNRCPAHGARIHSAGSFVSRILVRCLLFVVRRSLPARPARSVRELPGPRFERCASRRARREPPIIATKAHRLVPSAYIYRETS